MFVYIDQRQPGFVLINIEAPLWFYCVFWLRKGKLSWQYWVIDLCVRELVASSLYISPNDLTLCSLSVYSTVAIFPNHSLRSNFIVDSEHQVFKSFGSKKKVHNSPWWIILDGPCKQVLCGYFYNDIKSVGRTKKDAASTNKAIEQ